jgi:hypothetical protein
MKAKTWIILLGLCLISSVAAAATVKVITQEAMIRKDKRFFAPALVRAPFGAALQELGREGDWFRVSYQGKEGWIHKSAVQEQKFQVSSLAGGQAEELAQGPLLGVEPHEAGAHAAVVPASGREEPAAP